MTEFMTKYRFMIPIIETLAAAAAIYFLILWLIDPQGPYEPRFVTFTFILALTEYARRRFPLSAAMISKIDSFIQEGQELATRAKTGNLPIEDHNIWVDRMNDYFRGSDAPEFETRLNNSSGLVSYGDGSKKSRLLNSIDRRTRRLMEFLKELRHVD